MNHLYTYRFFVLRKKLGVESERRKIMSARKNLSAGKNLGRISERRKKI